MAYDTKRKPYRTEIENLIKAGKSPFEIKTLFPNLSHSYLVGVRRCMGIGGSFGYKALNGTTKDGRRIGPATKEWLKGRCVVDACGCWNWTMKLSKHGYGITKIRHRTTGVHRIAFSLWVSEIPKGKLVLHHCDNRKCCNPSHLYVGTNDDNMRDMVVRGRSGAAKLTPAQVLEIRKSDKQPKVLAKLFGVNVRCIRNAASGKTYKHVCHA